MTSSNESLSPAAARARLKRRADELGLEFEQAVLYYAMEGFLARLSRTEWADRMVVKGAAMLRVWDAAIARPTRDIDFLGRIDNSPGAISAAVRECVLVSLEDGLRFSSEVTTEAITVADRYPGVEATVRGDLSGARFTLRLDIGIDDAVVPSPEWVEYPPLLAAEGPRILAYRPATAVAEKFEAIVDLGLVNSRMKDFYDVWLLLRTQQFDGEELAGAVRATFEHRGTPLPVVIPVALTDEYHSDVRVRVMWETYRAKLAASGIDAPDELSEVVAAIDAFLTPIARTAGLGDGFAKTWIPDEGWVAR